MKSQEQPRTINVEIATHQLVQTTLLLLAEETGIDLTLLQALEILKGAPGYEAQVSTIEQTIKTQIGPEGLLNILQQLEKLKQAEEKFVNNLLDMSRGNM